jgi:hypothetical protein
MSCENTTTSCFHKCRAGHICKDRKYTIGDGNDANDSECVKQIEFIKKWEELYNIGHYENIKRNIVRIINIFKKLKANIENHNTFMFQLPNILDHLSPMDAHSLVVKFEGIQNSISAEMEDGFDKEHNASMFYRLKARAGLGM